MAQPLQLSLGSWWHLHTGPPGGGSRLSHRSCPKAFSGKNTFSSPVTPQGLLQLLTILFSICKSFHVESCHPESDSMGGWAEPEQAGARLPPSSSPARLPTSAGHPTSQATSRPPGKPGTGCSQPTSPSCQRAGRSELMAVPMALPVSQVLQFSLSPQPQPHSTPVISLLPLLPLSPARDKI